MQCEWMWQLVPSSTRNCHSAIADKCLVEEVRVSVRFVSVGIHANHHVCFLEIIFVPSSLLWDADSHKWSLHAEVFGHFKATLLQRVNHRLLDIINPWQISGQFPPWIIIFGFSWIIPHIWLSSRVYEAPVFVIVLVSRGCTGKASVLDGYVPPFTHRTACASQVYHGIHVCDRNNTRTNLLLYYMHSHVLPNPVRHFPANVPTSCRLVRTRARRTFFKYMMMTFWRL